MKESNFPKEEGRIRLVVLEFSIRVEKILSQTLCWFLNINGPSKSFGDKSSSLSLSQKSNLLLDTKYLNPEDASKLQIFMEIRNQFIHNEKAINFSTCLDYTNTSKSKVLGLYPHITDENEENRLEQCWHSLVEDIIKSVIKMKDIHLNKLIKNYGLKE